ncbi:phosphatase PAP2 family protein [Luteitalea sp.]
MRHCSVLFVTTLLCVSATPVCAQDTRVSADLAAPPAAAAIAAPAAPPAPTTADAPTEAIVPLTTRGRGAMPSVASLFTDLRGDLRRTADTTNAVIMVTAGASASLIHPYDFRLTDTFSSSPTLDRILGPGKVVGGFAVQFGGAWAAYGIGRVVKSERVAQVGADLVRAQLVNTIFTQGLKLSINRTRPDGDTWSFPSGHSSGSFANASVLHRHFGWKVGAPAYAVAAYVAASRLQERRHFASDVIFGAGIGIISGRAVTVGRGDNRFAVSPMGVPGGAGITFTRLAN